MDATRTRLLVVALDGCDGLLLDRMTRDGSLPNLSALRQAGRAWRLAAPPDSTDDSLWAAFQYGVGTGEHGRFMYVMEDDEGRRTYAPDVEQDREIFWDRLSDLGQRVAVLDVPKCRTPRPINGVHLTDWLVHGRYTPMPRSFPERLAEEVVAEFGEPPPSRCGYVFDSVLDDGVLTAVRDNLLRSVDMKRRAGLRFLSQSGWDLFLIAFKEAHCGAHLLWHLHDPTHPHHDPARNARLGDPLRDVLVALDGAIGDLVQAAGPGARVLVFCTSDMAPNGSLEHLHDDIAARINDALATELDGYLMSGLRRVLGRTRRLCRAVPGTDNAGALRLTRLPQDTDATHRARISRAATLACDLVDCRDGMPVIGFTSMPAQDHVGSSAGTLPHLVLHARPGCCPDAIRSPRLGRIAGVAPHIRPGNHAQGGFALASGAWGDAADGIRGMSDMAAAITCLLTGGDAGRP